jgi:sporulation protein YlmC with PRC-barrel domain
MRESETRDWRGYDVIDPDGSKIGTVEDFFVDRATDRPEWALVNMGLFGTKQTLVPFEGSSAQENYLRVPYDKDLVKDAPTLDPGDTITEDSLADLYRHYGLDEASMSRDQSAAADRPEGVPGDSSDAAPMAAGGAAPAATAGREREIIETQDELRERQDDLDERQDRLEEREAQLESRVDEIADREAELGERERRFDATDRDDDRADDRADDRGGILSGPGERRAVAPAGETRLKRFGE